MFPWPSSEVLSDTTENVETLSSGRFSYYCACCHPFSTSTFATASLVWRASWLARRLSCSAEATWKALAALASACQTA
jgi:hypothetical protein